MPHLASLVDEIAGSGTLAIKALATRLKREGKQIIEFTAGEPDFPTPEKIKEAAIRALQENFTRYTDTAGIPELRQAICEKLKRDNALEYTPEQILVTNGAKHAIYETLQVLLDPGDEVIIPLPFWTSYPEQVRLCRGVPVLVNTVESGFKITPEQLEHSITPKTKAIIFNSPSNPTGMVYTEQEIRELAEILIKKDIFIISDEIYEKIIFDGYRHFSPAQIAALYPRTIVINGFSKAYSMTGWRVGYLAGPEDIVRAVKKFQDHQTSNVNSITQKACIAALREVEAEIEMMRAAFEKRRNLICQLSGEIPYVSAPEPKGAFYLYMDVREVCHRLNVTSSELVKILIEHAGIVVVPGEAFGTPGYLRFSYATSEDEITKGMNQLKKYLQQL